MNSPWCLSVCVLMMISLISTGYNKLSYWLHFHVPPAAWFLSRAPLLCISLPMLYWFIDSSIHLLQGGDRLAFDSHILEILQPAGKLLEVLEFCPNWQNAKHSSLLQRGWYKVIIVKYRLADMPYPASLKELILDLVMVTDGLRLFSQVLLVRTLWLLC